MLADVEILAPADEEVLTREALDLVARLQRELNPRRRELLERRRQRQADLDAGTLPGFLTETSDVRQAEWRVSGAPAGLPARGPRPPPGRMGGCGGPPPISATAAARSRGRSTAR